MAKKKKNKFVKQRGPHYMPTPEEIAELAAQIRAERTEALEDPNRHLATGGGSRPRSPKCAHKLNLPWDW